NAGTSFSNDYGNSFSPSSVATAFGGGDPTLATGASGRFYRGGINFPPAGCADAVDIDATKTGAAFGFAGNAVLCPPRGNICLPDQPQMAADAVHATSTGDQLYVVWRNFLKPWYDQTVSTCNAIISGDHTPLIACSSNSGATWGSTKPVGFGDWGR